MKQIRRKFVFTLLLVVSTMVTFATQPFNWQTINTEAGNFNTTAVAVGQYIAGGILALALAFMLYQLVGNNPKKKESVIAFIIALILNSLLWVFIA